MSKFKDVNSKIENSVIEGYKKIEDTAVGSYQKIENTAVKGYTYVQDKFVDTFFKKDNETLDEAKNRINKEINND